MSALIEVSIARHRFHGATADVLTDVQLEIHSGESLGIVGESGSGKTTLGRIIAGAIQPTEGEVLVAGVPWATARRRSAQRRVVQTVFQDPYGALNPRMTPLAAVAEVFEVWDHVTRRVARERAGQLLEEVGLSGGAITRRPGELSGGQCQRVGIARALACRPDVLIADEPTSALDVSVQAQILNLLSDLTADRGLALVLISHDLGLVRHVTRSALVMKEGRVVERGSTSDLLDRPSHPYTRLLVESVPGRTER